MYSTKILSLFWIYLVTIPTIVFLKPIFSLLIGEKSYRRRSYAWIATTATIFLTPDFLTFLVVYLVILYYYTRTEENNAALLTTLIFAVPVKNVALPDILGFPLFTITNVTVLCVVLLLGGILRSNSEKSPNKSNINRAPLKYIFLFLMAQTILWADSQTATHTLRLAISTTLLPFILPLGLILTVNSREKLLDVIYSLLFGILLLAPVGLLEIAKQWYLYTDATANWAVSILSGYQAKRDFSIRSTATLESPLILGEVLAIGLIILHVTFKSLPKKIVWRAYLTAIILIAAIYFTRSKSPLIFLACGFTIYITGISQTLPKSNKLLVCFAIGFGTLAVTSGLISPELFYKETSSGEYLNIIYRNNISSALWNITTTFPLRGYRDVQSVLVDFRQGEGIIDLLNVYLSFAASFGLGTALLLIIAQIKVVNPLVLAIPSVSRFSGEDARLAWAILALIVSHAIFMYTISWLSSTSNITWLLLSLGALATQLHLSERSANETRKG